MSNVSIKQERVVSNGSSTATAAAAAVDVVAQELSAAYQAAVPEDEKEKTNLLLTHACSCDDAQCRDPEFRLLCAHMKRFLRAACWASHSERWRSYPIATAVVELFTHHALHCQALQCNVPMCRQLRGQVLL
ncbi:histone acetyltransferase p300-like [Phytophthora cinnamomi]|uniref:histone acetyltransferase p300-like n=1 Tax=Phytophthora cinnamomi TaxID=4785 RepID=UPI00355937BE|nr:histone acetyltransferase p300-like [Phytophthora cinnamomi]